jgi:hypothetical protein
MLGEGVDEHSQTSPLSPEPNGAPPTKGRAAGAGSGRFEVSPNSFSAAQATGGNALRTCTSQRAGRRQAPSQAGRPANNRVRSETPWASLRWARYSVLISTMSTALGHSFLQALHDTHRSMAAARRASPNGSSP